MTQKFSEKYFDILQWILWYFLENCKEQGSEQASELILQVMYRCFQLLRIVSDNHIDA